MRYNGKRWEYKCEEAGCASQPSEGFKPDHFPRFCRKHRRRGCIRMKKERHCSHDGCRTRPSFGLPGMKAARCRRHALDGEINVNSKRCRFEGCGVRANFGVGDKTDWCKKHAPAGSTRKVSASQVCRVSGCTTWATFGTEWRKPKHCAQHATNDEDYCMARRCLAPLDGGGECLTRPSFGPPGGRKMRCATHREPGHVDLVSKRCAHDGCDKHPSFGTEATSALFCGRHKRVSDTNVKDKKCSTARCEKHPSYGPAPETEGGPRTRLRCATHAIASDVQNKDKRAAGFGKPAPRFRGGHGKARSSTRKRVANEV